jgi:hypothetical protein
LYLLVWFWCGVGVILFHGWFTHSSLNHVLFSVSPSRAGRAPQWTLSWDTPKVVPKSGLFPTIFRLFLFVGLWTHPKPKS